MVVLPCSRVLKEYDTNPGSRRGGAFTTFPAWPISLEGGVVAEQRQRRKSSRQRFNAPVSLYWEDNSGATQYARGVCVDISAEGLRIELAQPLVPPKHIRFRIDEIHLQGSGSVRYCRSQPPKTVLGIEFTGGIRLIAEALRDFQRPPA